jgi:phospholipase C
VSVGSTYDLSVYGPNGFARYFQSSTGSGAARLDVVSSYDIRDGASIELKIINTGRAEAEVSVTRRLHLRLAGAKSRSRRHAARNVVT